MGFENTAILIESTTSPTSGNTGQDWVLTSGDPDNINLSLWTADIDYKIFDVLDTQDLLEVEIKRKYTAGGRGYKTQFGKWIAIGYVLKARMNTETEYETWQRFVHEHSLANANDLYFVIKKRGGTTYRLHWDPVGQVNRKYMIVDLEAAPGKLSGNRYLFDRNVVINGRWS